MDLIVANDLSKPGAGFEVETNEVILIPRDGQVKHLQKMPKRAVAKAVLDEYVQRRANQ
jgi:phosphopantothenoylcysteine decarboxylase/phosphopantothenate--cysteine ligase